jgi:hypothetical protein
MLRAKVDESIPNAFLTLQTVARLVESHIAPSDGQLSYSAAG